MRYGGPDKLPGDCQSNCVADGKIKKDSKECVRCRGKGTLRLGKSDGKADKQPFDPSRVKDTVKQIAEKLNEGGKKCVKRVAQATSKLQTLIRRWRHNDPTLREQTSQETDTKQLGEVQGDLDKTAESSARLEDEFEDDEQGKAYRAKGFLERLQDKIADANKPDKCGTEFDALKTAFNTIVEEYSSLPTTLKGQGVQRVMLKFSDTDIGSTDLTNSKSMCKFAGRLVSQLKKAENYHKKRLAGARALVCKKAGKVLKQISDVTNCLRKARRDAKAGNDAEAAQNDALKFDNNAFQQVLKLVRLMKKKCLMRDTPQSIPAAVTGVFREKLLTKITKISGALTEEEKKQLAEKFNDAVEQKYPRATNIETAISDTGRRQLHTRRGLAAAFQVVTTWDADSPPQASDNVVVLLDGNFTSSPPELSAEPTSGSIVELTASITPIDTNLPDGEDEATNKPDGEDEATNKPAVTTGQMAETADTDGAMEAAFGSAASVICATLCFFGL